MNCLRGCVRSAVQQDKGHSSSDFQKSQTSQYSLDCSLEPRHVATVDGLGSTIRVRSQVLVASLGTIKAVLNLHCRAHVGGQLPPSSTLPPSDPISGVLPKTQQRDRKKRKGELKTRRGGGIGEAGI
uniref:Uncharacterized protein n=1 Tax=Timema monikensis TaxID=170555 RepID=A0A7R9E589_9NEOP|nr:unnamed protein product [Timema monikensis]